MMPRRLLFQQGTADAPVRHPAEDVRLAFAGLFSPLEQDALTPRPGILFGGQMKTPSGTANISQLNAFVEPGKMTFAPGRVVICGDSALQSAYLAVADAFTPRLVDEAKTNPGLPGAGQFKAGLAVARVYDQLYGDAVDGWDIELYMGTAAETAASAPLPTKPPNSTILRAITIDSAGAITSIAGSAHYTAVRGDTIFAQSNARPAQPYQNLKIRENDSGVFRRWDFNRWVYIGTDAPPFQSDSAVIQRTPMVVGYSVGEVVPANNEYVPIKVWTLRRTDPTVATYDPVTGEWTIAERGIYSILASQSSQKPGIGGRVALKLDTPGGGVHYNYYGFQVSQLSRPAVASDAGNVVEHQVVCGPAYLEAGWKFKVHARFTHTGGDFLQACDHTITIAKLPHPGP